MNKGLFALGASAAAAGVGIALHYIRKARRRKEDVAAAEGFRNAMEHAEGFLRTLKFRPITRIENSTILMPEMKGWIDRYEGVIGTEAFLFEVLREGERKCETDQEAPKIAKAYQLYWHDVTLRASRQVEMPVSDSLDLFRRIHEHLWKFVHDDAATEQPS